MTERVLVYSRVDCHLCEEAKAALARLGIPYTEVDVDADPELRGQYGDLVPVIMLDGREHSFWRVEEARLLRDLTV